MFEEREWVPYNTDKPVENNCTVPADIQEGEKSEYNDGRHGVYGNSSFCAFGKNLGCVSGDRYHGGSVSSFGRNIGTHTQRIQISAAGVGKSISARQTSRAVRIYTNEGGLEGSYAEDKITALMMWGRTWIPAFWIATTHGEPAAPFAPATRAAVRVGSLYGTRTPIANTPKT
jgi:hypothetical protein